MRQNSPTDIWKFVPVRGEGCWLWQGAQNRKGYGQFRCQGTLHIASRFVWELTYGGIPEGQQVLHKCDNPPCVNPEHLFLGTNQENVDDKMAKKRHWTFAKTACKNGHPYVEGSFYVKPGKNGRACLVCSRESCRKNHLRLKLKYANQDKSV